jgi:hypothetical protein
MIKKISLVACLLSVWAFGQCGGCLVSTRVGVKGGLILCNYQPGDGSNAFTGTGSHFGFGMGTDFLKLISVDVTPQIMSTNFSREEIFFERTYAYQAIYFPVFVSLKAGMIPLVSPYVGLGLGFGLITSANEIHRFYDDNDTTMTPISGASATAYLILGGGVEIKLLKFRINPEFTVQLQPRPEDDPNAAETKNYHLSLGLYYAP